ncbi:unnamed protein product [Cylicocyclus nassatus]|uniref:Uncharacterized protein n=1 Tax=Cylicocyclus nassatus TaxID=53992 RepID=A0AA36DWS0_CYLNA|nr:unnamed protein product [Cylicocyclus nassatus]
MSAIHIHPSHRHTQSDDSMATSFQASILHINRKLFMSAILLDGYLPGSYSCATMITL